MKYRLERPGDVDLEFDGEQIAFQSSRHRRAPRWTEVRIYRLDSGEGWITRMTGRTIHEGEKDLETVKVCRTPIEVRDALRRRDNEYLIDAAVDAIDEAVERDPRLADAAVERL